MNEELKVIISAEIVKLKQGIDNAKKEVKSFKEQVSAAGANVEGKFKSMGSASVNAAKTLAAGAAAGVAALAGVAAATEEYRQNQAKLITAFESAGGSAKDAASTYNDLYRVLGDGGQATEAAAHLAKLTTEEKALSQWTTICQGVYATFGDSLPIEGLTEAANETAKVGQVTGGLADALNWAGISEDAFNEKLAACNNEAEREKLIRETLIGVYDEAAAKYEENAAATLAQNEAQAKLEANLAKVGAAMAPVLTAFTSFGGEVLGALTPHLQTLAEALLPALQSGLEAAAAVIETIAGFIAENIGLLTAVAALITTVTVAIGLYNAVAAVKAAMAAAEVTTVWALVSAYAAQGAAMLVAIAPYVAVVAGIAAVIAIIVLAVKHWDKITAATKKAWENIQKATKEAVDKVVKKFNELKEKSLQKVEQLKTDATKKFNETKTNAINKFNELKTGAVNKAQELRQGVVDKFNSMKSGITEKMNNAKSSVTTGFSNIVSAAKQKAQAVLDTVGDKFGAIKDKVKTALNNAKGVVDDGIAKIKKAFDFEWKLPKPKIPSFNVSGGEAPWGFGGKGSLPRISINWNALGGVFDAPTLFAYGSSLQGIGEDGAEAVVPLEKNTMWLTKIADMLSDRMGGNTPIVLEVDGKVFAQTAINTINAQTRQQGRLALNII